MSFASEMKNELTRIDVDEMNAKSRAQCTDSNEWCT